MNAYHNELLSIMENASRDLTEIHFREECLKHNIKHVRTDDCLTVGRAFCRRHPEYRMLRLVEPHNKNESVFTTLVLTMHDYDTPDMYGGEA